MKPRKEAADLSIVERLIFQPNGLDGQPYTHTELLVGRTSDFRVFKDGKHVAHCEVKSPNDPWLDDFLEDAEPFELRGGLRIDPTFNRLSRHIQKAASQFEAVDPNRELPSILAFVNHDNKSGFGDLLETLTGFARCDDGSAIPTNMHIAWNRLKDIKCKIDVYVMIDASVCRIQGYAFNESNPKRVIEVCQLLQLDPARIKAA